MGPLEQNSSRLPTKNIDHIWESNSRSDRIFGESGLINPSRLTRFESLRFFRLSSISRRFRVSTPYFGQSFGLRSESTLHKILDLSELYKRGPFLQSLELKMKHINRHFALLLSRFDRVFRRLQKFRK